VISPGRLWWLFRRDLSRGWEATFHDYFTVQKIENWSGVPTGTNPHSVPIHVLTGAGDWRLAAWMLASFFEATEHAWPVVIHDDGTLPQAAGDTLRRLFPNARIITRAEADAAIGKQLQRYPFCHEYRSKHPLAQKIFDVPALTEGKRYMIFDSDVLFFNHPREIWNWAAVDNEECWFNEDIEDAALLTAAEARDDLGVRLWQRVNSGLGLIYKPAIDLDFMDRVLAETSVLRGKVWRIEQTLYALCASRHGKGGLLPARYEVSLSKHAAPDVTARHYVGAVRHRFFAEGLKRLREQLLASHEA
jgi:hypothetical protein